MADQDRHPSLARDAIPAEFSSYEEAAEFWDIHDTADYPENFIPVQVEAVEMRERHYEIEIDEDLRGPIEGRSKADGVPVQQLVSGILREKLAETESRLQQ